MMMWGGVAHSDPTNELIGPVLGISWKHGKPTRGFIGIEAGFGIGPERLNFGLSNRDGEAFGYAELDPWLYLGASLGVGIGAQSGPHPVLGVWEGVPLGSVCSGPRLADGQIRIFTLSVGWRWSGANELYVAPKAGVMDPFCLD